MTVKELINTLKGLNPNALVVASSDSEGNHYDTIDGFSTGNYDAANHEFGLAKEGLTHSMRVKGYTEEDIKEGVAAVCLWP